MPTNQELISAAIAPLIVRLETAEKRIEDLTTVMLSKKTKKEPKEAKEPKDLTQLNEDKEAVLKSINDFPNSGFSILKTVSHLDEKRYAAAIKVLLEEKKIVKTGERRATTYSLPSLLEKA